MFERKQHVVNKAHQLFIEKGFQSTSVQDILDESGISKGTFYNYFSSKSDLFKAVLISIRKQHEVKRNELLIGENRADMEIFIKQIDIIMESNKTNKLFTLISEILVSNDPDLKMFITEYQFAHLSWMFERLVDIFGEEKRPYLLDCAILFFGMLHQSLHYNVLAKDSYFNRLEVIRYCTARLIQMVEDVSAAKVQMLDPDLFKKWLPSSENSCSSYNEIFSSLADLKKTIIHVVQTEAVRMKHLQNLNFMHEELTKSKQPRLFLIESTLLSIQSCPEIQQTEELSRLKQLLSEHVLKDY
ncbi:TetR/AcrR family transcriptional regulator [Bacillus benzoevorans]|uniref:AcrR family transcriptional regulator n=1 Tax=Bacillus benzoevorans TaxID=1456 RepID=A0A7X0HR15_9BACI|nr:TetR/AcrR family transcriptional regulator [Bacillus benzoevorans]MBB6445365.1 AcrR family transcriptional regulator [Bacillus benzoevorans]